jgi:putative transposase
MLACDFLTVETVWLTRIYVLFFVSLERRRIEFVSSTSSPDERWVAQQANNLLMHLGDRDQSFRFLLHDRDSKFSGAFNEVFRSEGMRMIRTPIRAPNANAYAERWVGTLRRECLDRILIINRRHLEKVLRVYIAHYNRHRPQRSLSLQPPDQPPAALVRAAAIHIHKREVLGGLINEYKAAA